MGRKPTKEEIELGQLLQEEKLTMAGFYQRMSGEVDWRRPDEKEAFGEVFEELSKDIKKLQGRTLIKE